MAASIEEANDLEIVEIFAEEAAEVLESIDHNLGTLRAKPKDRAALGEVRRAFHTLKGSGRMVKALDLGELAWRVENMLNRAIEGTIPVSETLTALVADCRAVMPRLVDAFRSGRKPGMEEELEALMARADAIAAGQPAPAAVAPAEEIARPAAIRGEGPVTQDRLNELYRRFDRATQRADEALHRSEMALQNVRRLATRIDAVAVETRERTALPELQGIGNRVSALASEVVELRQAVRRPHAEAGVQPRDIQALIDQRLRERMSAVERLKGDLERQIAEVRREAARARSVGLWALVIGLLLAMAGLVVLMNKVSS